MQIDINELIELVKSVKPMFLNHTEAEHVTVKGRADFVTQVDIRVQEYMRNELSKRWPDVQFMGEEKDNSTKNKPCQGQDNKVPLHEPAHTSFF